MGQFRVLRSALESQYGKRLAGDHCAIPWLVRHAAAVVGRYQIGADGKTAHRRLRGRDFRRDVADFGECVMYLRPETVGKDKAESRWEEGAWLGVRDESGEIIIGTNKGVIKARTFKRYGRDEDRWCVEKFEAFRGVPWEPVPGRGRGGELKCTRG